MPHNDNRRYYNIDHDSELVVTVHAFVSGNSMPRIISEIYFRSVSGILDNINFGIAAGLV